jgi:hypothetical protein
MPWFNVGSGSRREKSKRMQRFQEADRVVVEIFADLHEVRHLKISPTAVQRFERKAWDRLIEYLLRLPPLPDDY